MLTFVVVTQIIWQNVRVRMFMTVIILALNIALE